MRIGSYFTIKSGCTEQGGSGSDLEENWVISAFQMAAQQPQFI